MSETTPKFCSSRKDWDRACTCSNTMWNNNQSYCWVMKVAHTIILPNYVTEDTKQNNNKTDNAFFDLTQKNVFADFIAQICKRCIFLFGNTKEKSLHLDPATTMHRSHFITWSLYSHIKLLTMHNRIKALHFHPQAKNIKHCFKVNKFVYDCL